MNTRFDEIQDRLKILNLRQDCVLTFDHGLAEQLSDILRENF